MLRDVLVKVLLDDVFLKLGLLLHRVQQHFALPYGLWVAGNAQQLGEGVLRVVGLVYLRFEGRVAIKFIHVHRDSI